MATKKKVLNQVKTDVKFEAGIDGFEVIWPHHEHNRHAISRGGSEQGGDEPARIGEFTA